MRQIATYSLSRADVDSIDLPATLAQCRAFVDGWLTSKTGNDDHLTTEQIVLKNGGRHATLQREDFLTPSGTMFAITLTEPSGAGRFQTYFACSYDDSDFVLFCQLRTATDDVALARVNRYSPYCPEVVRKIVKQGRWLSGMNPVETDVIACVDRDGGRRLQEMIWNFDRTLPIVVISEYQEFPLHPNLSSGLAYDLVGMATVVEIDAGASWLITEQQGREWSCYGGAVRLYWPMRDEHDSPFWHPLWTQSKLLSNAHDTKHAAGRIRNQIRRMILSRSAFRGEPALIRRIRTEHLTDQVTRAKDRGEFEELSRAYERENSALKDKIESLEDQVIELEKKNEELAAQVRQLDIAKRWQSSEMGDIEPDDVSPPTTVMEAVNLARTTYNRLVFGRDVNEGVKALNATAGPPEKVLRYLQVLDKIATDLATGALSGGEQYQQKFRDHGVHMSGEGGLSRAQKQMRTWDDGSGERKLFISHLKVNEKTSPDRCVRIYFEWDNKVQKFKVGWVGRHPG